MKSPYVLKHPEGMGHWPAFWMMPQASENDSKKMAKDGENDLMNTCIPSRQYRYNQQFITLITILSIHINGE